MGIREDLFNNTSFNGDGEVSFLPPMGVDWRNVATQRTKWPVSQGKPLVITDSDDQEATFTMLQGGREVR